MIVDQSVFRLANCGLDGVKLLGEFDARPAFLDPCNNRTKVAVRALQAGDDIGVTGVRPLYPPGEDMSTI